MYICVALEFSERSSPMKVYNIAIDGPSGAGKSTVAKLLAEKLGIMYLDTGALYRTVGLKAMRSGWHEDNDFVSGALASTDIKVKFENGVQRMYLDGEDVTEAIRLPGVSDYGSRFSALPCVRSALLGLQRKAAEENSSVLDGRDIGTCVLPDAEYKFFLTASVDNRAHRRYNDLKAKGLDVNYDEIKADITARDERDINRMVSPLRKADDAVEINSDYMTAEEVAKRIMAFIKK